MLHDGDEVNVIPFLIPEDANQTVNWSGKTFGIKEEGLLQSFKNASGTGQRGNARRSWAERKCQDCKTRIVCGFVDCQIDGSLIITAAYLKLQR